MDMSHLKRRGARIVAPPTSRLDYRVLVATVQAWQLSTATARAEGRSGPHREMEATQPAPLAEILLGAQDWQQAVLAQGGSFNPVFARFGEAW